MPDLPRVEGYQLIAPLSSHDFTSQAKSIIYRAVCTLDNKPVVLKILNASYPTEVQLQKYTQEFYLLKSLESVPGVIRVFELLRLEKTLGLVIENFPGNSLMDWLNFLASKLDGHASLKSETVTATAATPASKNGIYQ